MRPSLLLPLPVALLALAACNAPPTAPEIVINPGEPRTDADLAVVFLAITTDENKDEVTHTFRWFESGTLRSDLTTDTIPAAETERGETWKVVVTPNDGEFDGEPAEAEVVILDTEPVASVTLGPDGAATDDDLVAAAIAEDIDGDTVTFTYAWTRDGQALDWMEATVPAAQTAHGETWAVTATPNDGELAGVPVTASITVGNTLPTVESVTLEPTPAYEDSLMLATAFGVDDLDDDTVALTYTWFVNETEVQSGEDDSLTGALFNKHDLVRVEVTPADSFVNGTPIASDDLLVENSVPSGTSVSVVSSAGDGLAYETSTLTCTPSGFSDADGDTEAWTFGWQVDGATVSTASSIAGDLFNKGSVVTCVATPTDGEVSGAPLTASAVRVANSLPVLASATLSTIAPTESDTLSVTLGAATDADADTISFAYDWTVNGSLVATSSTLTASRWQKGDTIAVTVTPYDGTDTGAPVTSGSAIAVNSAPEVRSVSLTPSSLYTNDTVTASVTTSDADGDTVGLSYQWYVNGVPRGTDASSLAGATWFDKNDSVYVVVTLDDGSDGGSATTSSSVTVGNSAPSATSAAITSSSLDGYAYEGSTLTCQPTGWRDADGDVEGWNYSWVINGIAASTSASINGTLFGKSDTIGCTVTPTDGMTSGTPVSASTVRIRNTAPTLTDVVLSKSAPSEGDTLAATMVGGNDVDADTISYIYDWKVNGSSVSSSSTLASTAWLKGDNITLTVTPTDGTDRGRAVTSAAATAVNTVPVVTSVSLTPSSVYTNDTLTAAVTSSDADGDTVGLRYEWYVNGVIRGTNASTLSGTSFFGKGDSVYVVVTPTDTDGAGTAYLSTSVTVLNSAPTAPVVSIDPADPMTNDTLVCNVDTDSTDADGDAFSYTFSWTQDGAAFRSAGRTYEAGDTVPGSNVAYGDVWACSATPSDGATTGSAARTSVTIDPTCVPAFDLAGTAYEVFPRAASMSFGTAWSVSIWTYNRSTAANGALFNDGYSGTYCASFGLNLEIGTGRPFIGMHGGTSGNRCEPASGWAYGAARGARAWTHTVVVVNGGTIRFYQDGALTTTSAISATDPYTPIRDLWLGWEANRPSSEIFNGAVSDLAFWTRALTASEAASVFADSPESVTSGLVGWWPMDEGSGTTLNEASGLANDGVIYGAGAWTQRCEDGSTGD